MRKERFEAERDDLLDKVAELEKRLNDADEETNLYRIKYENGLREKSNLDQIIRDLRDSLSVSLFFHEIFFHRVQFLENIFLF